EALQFFSVFGFTGTIGASLLALSCYLWFCSTVMKDGHQLANAPSGSSMKASFRYYCGKPLGVFYEVYTTVFMFFVFVIMIAAAGSIFSEYYQVNTWIGRLAMATVTLGTVLLGLNRLVDIVSKFAYALVVFALAIGIAN